MSEKQNEIIEASAYPSLFDADTEMALKDGTANMAQLSLQGMRDAWELRKLANPSHGEPRDVDIDPVEVAEVQKLLGVTTGESPIWPIQ